MYLLYHIVSLRQPPFCKFGLMNYLSFFMKSIFVNVRHNFYKDLYSLDIENDLIILFDESLLEKSHKLFTKVCGYFVVISSFNALK